MKEAILTDRGKEKYRSKIKPKVKRFSVKSFVKELDVGRMIMEKSNIFQ
jgi:hypothetical protein